MSRGQSAKSRAHQRMIAAQVYERKRQALIDTFAGDDADQRAVLEAMSYAEIVAHKNAGNLTQPTLPEVTE